MISIYNTTLKPRKYMYRQNIKLIPKTCHYTHRLIDLSILIRDISI